MDSHQFSVESELGDVSSWQEAQSMQAGGANAWPVPGRLVDREAATHVAMVHHRCRWLLDLLHPNRKCPVCLPPANCNLVMHAQ
jgi:hypothetical protein